MDDRDQPVTDEGAERLSDTRAGTGGETPADPQQTEHGFGEGMAREPRTAEDERVGDFATGQEREPRDAGAEVAGRFSEGQEEVPDDPENSAQRRFSEGQESGPDST